MNCLTAEPGAHTAHGGLMTRWIVHGIVQEVHLACPCPLKTLEDQTVCKHESLPVDVH